MDPRRAASGGVLPAATGPDVRGVQVVRLAGVLDASRAAALAGRMARHVAAARTLGQPLVLDLADVTLLGEAAVAALDAATRQYDGGVVAAVTPDPRTRQALVRALLPGVGVHASVTDALAALAAGPTAAPLPEAPGAAGAAPAGGSVAGLRAELYGLRARARSRGLIGVAQGMVLARYGLAEPQAAFALLRDVSQARNVPLRVLASALVSAPPPPRSGPWFAGRRRVPPPDVPLLAALGGHPAERGRVLQAVVAGAVERTGADAAALHLADRGQGGALVLEAHRGHTAEYCDAYAHVVSAATAAARAHDSGRPVTGTETVPAHPGEERAHIAGAHTVHAVPVVAPGSACTGALSVQQAGPGRTPPPGLHAALGALAADTARWLSWYRRTVLLDALELLHARAAATREA
ncbi:ANTAR domain-containing protein [Streptomyces sp. NPDC020983]|uniref:ANTAR domain-containing protein n=1 Tax=Streptomyces sp. NPDC020983 TaxID=3365106 RepID=UPI0037BDC196